jgi:hypothetical protein
VPTPPPNIFNAPQLVSTEDKSAPLEWMDCFSVELPGLLRDMAPGFCRTLAAIGKLASLLKLINPLPGQGMNNPTPSAAYESARIVPEKFRQLFIFARIVGQDDGPRPFRPETRYRMNLVVGHGETKNYLVSEPVP